MTQRAISPPKPARGNAPLSRGDRLTTTLAVATGMVALALTIGPKAVHHLKDAGHENAVIANHIANPSSIPVDEAYGFSVPAGSSPLTMAAELSSNPSDRRAIEAELETEGLENHPGNQLIAGQYAAVDKSLVTLDPTDVTRLSPVTHQPTASDSTS